MVMNIQEIRDSPFLLVVHKISIKIYFHASIGRLATLHRVFRNTIVVSSHYLFSVDKFATRIRHKIHCACNDYANLPEMQRRGLIAINLNNDRGGSGRKIVCAKTETWKKKKKKRRQHYRNHVQNGPNSWYFFVLSRKSFWRIAWQNESYHIFQHPVEIDCVFQSKYNIIYL